MPEFRPPSEVQVEEAGTGWSRALLADARHVPGMPMAAHRWSLSPRGVAHSGDSHGDKERFLYVISGSGTIRVGDQSFGVWREDLVWLEPGDSFVLEAAADGLELLEAEST